MNNICSNYDCGEVKLKSTIKEYFTCYNGNFNSFKIPAKYLGMNWNIVREVKDMKELFSDEITIFVDKNYIENI